MLNAVYAAFDKYIDGFAIDTSAGEIHKKSLFSSGYRYIEKSMPLTEARIQITC